MSGVGAIRAVVAAAETFQPEPEPEATVPRLAALSPFDYDRVRDAEVKRLGVRVATLDQQVTKARVAAEADSTEDDNASTFLTDPEPWPEPVVGADLLNHLVDVLNTYMVLPTNVAEAIALWVIIAHAHDCFDISPLLAVTSPTPECGKTTLMTTLGELVPRRLPASNITAATLFRAVEKWRPTLLIDEADTFLRDSDELRGVMNSGHHRANAYVLRTVGDDHEPTPFSTWSPKVVALIGKLPATLASRAIHVELRRKTATEKVSPLRLDRLGHLEPLKRQAARWAKDKAIALRAADPEMPLALYGRTADNWRPLLAIADVVGGDWPDRARRAAEALSVGRAEQTAGIMLLEDIRRVFADRAVDRIKSEELANALADLEDRPWPEWKNDKRITARQVAKLLEPFEIRPGPVRFPEKVLKGYHLHQFDEAFGRYLPSEPVTPLQTSKSATLGAAISVTPGNDVTDQDAPQPLKSAACNGVTDQAPEGWEGDL